MHANKIMNSLLPAIAVSGVIVVAGYSPVAAQTYPPTLKVPVTFYDYHSNKSNPEFERNPGAGGLHLNMVARKLDAENKPVRGATPYWNCEVARWFRPWTPTTSIPNYDSPATTGCGNPYKTVTYDTAFKNVIFQDTLTFTYVLGSPGTYTYANGSFFPLDGKAGSFGNEGNTHNYSFAMEMHYPFTMAPGLRFIFEGDDDVWAFINDSLVMDIGGIHSAMRDTIYVDSIPGLVVNQKCTLDLFYCERHVTGSDIKITTNIISAIPENIKMTKVPNLDTIPAGDSITMTANVLNDSGKSCVACNNNVHWILVAADGQPTGSTLTPAIGQMSAFHAVDAYRSYYITATFDTIINGQPIHLSYLDTIYVLPGAPTHLTVEANPGNFSLWDDARVVSRTFTSIMSKDSVYAVLRDQYGNWVRQATSSSWLSRDTAVVTVAPGSSADKGIITRVSPNGTTYVRATQGAFFDSVQVILNTVSYSSIQIYVLSGGIRMIDTLKMRTDQDTILRARSLRNDGSNIWDDLAVNWSHHAGMTFNNPAPNNVSSWSFMPTTPDTGFIAITYGSLNDTIRAFFSPGLPNQIALYPRPGQPDIPGNNAYPSGSTIYVTAGSLDTLVAKLFGGTHNWLSSYERSDAPISWTLQEISGTGSTGLIDPISGFRTVFSPRKAYNLVRIKATFSAIIQGTPVTLSDSVMFFVLPALATHLVIEADSLRTVSPNADNPVDSITIGGASTTVPVYAILRDQFGNWVGYSIGAEWQSADTSVATVSPGAVILGEGIITRRPVNGQTLIFAQDASIPGPRNIDTVKVVVNSLSYTELRIVVQDTIRINELTITTDDDTLLGVQGKRSDNNLWENITALWTIIGGIGVSPGTVQSWIFAPNVIGAGEIIVTKDGAITDTINVTVLHGRPDHLVLYPDTAIPGTSNAPYPSPSIIIIDSAGIAFPMAAKIFDRNNVYLTEYNNTGAAISWSIIEAAGNMNTPTGSLSPVQGNRAVFIPDRAYNTVYLTAAFGSIPLRDSVQIQVVSAQANHLVIEGTSNWQQSPNDDNPVDVIQITGIQQTYNSLFAVIRDAFGNFVDYSVLTDWTSLNTSIVTVPASTVNSGVGQGLVTRVATQGTTTVTAANNPNPSMKDSVAVVVVAYTYTRLRIVTGPGNDTIASLTMTTNQDTTLRVQGLRSDNSSWEPVAAGWEISSGIKVPVSQSPPAASDTWTFSPADTGQGWIRVTLGNDLVIIPDTVRVVFTLGAPWRLSIYPHTGKPDTADNYPYASSMTVRAGDTVPLCAKLFERRNIWLSAYERPDAPFVWRMEPVTGGIASGPLSTSNGFSTIFYPQNAYTTVRIISRFEGVVPTLSDTIIVTVNPGVASQLSIESSPDSMQSLRENARLGVITLTASMQQDSVYAVLRDRFGNWVSRAIYGEWQSRNPSFVLALKGRAAFGEGFIIRQSTDNVSTYVIVAQDTLTDSLQVILRNTTYSMVQIYVRSGGIYSIDTLKMRTDQDTTLYARGLLEGTVNSWEDLLVSWNASPGLSFDRTPPVSGAYFWSFNPQTEATGVIYIIYKPGTVELRDSVQAIFSTGNANHMALYPLPGSPSSSTPLPVSMTVVVGTPLQIVAKLFDNKNTWLSSYERADAPFTWTMDEISGTGLTGSLSNYEGFQTVFTPRRAYNVVRITASFSENGISVPSVSIVLTIVPGPATHVVIEADNQRSTSPNVDNPAGTIILGGNAARVPVYAILRDQFGNWVGYSTATEWRSFDTALAVAQPGNQSMGEGIIVRKADYGQTRVTAKDATMIGPGNIDTVAVVMNTISYRALKIVVRDSIDIQQLTMRTDQDTLLSVLGLRSDTTKWESVIANWSIVPRIRTSPIVPQSANSWRFSSLDTGTGLIIVTLNESTASDTIAVRFIHGGVYKLVLYPQIGIPGGVNAPYSSPSTAIVDSAGKPIPLAAKIFDRYDVWISEYDSSTAPIVWDTIEITGNPPTGTLSAFFGNASVFTPFNAYNKIFVVATFDNGMLQCRDSVLIDVVPAAPRHLVIEADPNWRSHPNHDNPADSIEITNSETNRYAYAVIRDQYGNFIDYSKRTNWRAIDSTGAIDPDTSLITVRNGTNSIGQGSVSRIGSQGWARAIAVSGEFSGLADSIKVKVLQYYYLRLRIVAGQSRPIDFLSMSTNDDTTLYVQGLRSDDSVTWEDVPMIWENSAGLRIDPSAPERAASWSFSPVAPADGGWIRVSSGNDSLTTPDSIFVNFTRGSIMKVDISILTPPNRRIAGDTITAVVRISNADGLLPDSVYCDTAIHQELLGNGNGSRPDPVLIVDGSSSGVNKYPSTSVKTPECFTFGLDTIKYILYYASSRPDSADKLFVTINGINAATEPFNVLPADLNSIAICDYSGAKLDTVALSYPDGSQVFFAVGYDRFGNRCAIENGIQWTATDSLHAVDHGTNVTRIYYDASQVKHDEGGFIRVLTFDTAQQIISDSVLVIIKGPMTFLMSAVTRDVDGDGYLDRLVLHFSKAVVLPVSKEFRDSINIFMDPNDVGNNTFAVDSIIGDSTKTIYTLLLHELQNNAPQTAWIPTLTVKQKVTGLTPILGFPCSDGAGPVIWYVEKEIKSLDDNRQDVVTVTFSEPVRSSDGDAFKLGIQPGKVFYVFRKDISGNLFRDSAMLDEFIPNFDAINTAKTIVSFTMKNGHDLTASNYLSLIPADSSLISDNTPSALANNCPERDNQKVQVVVKAPTPKQIVVSPNPSRPMTVVRVPAGKLFIDHEPNARNWVLHDRAGTILNFKVALTSESDQTLAGAVVIYDGIGNVVNKAGDNTTNLLASTNWRNGNVYDYDIYWNGTNMKGMKVAPGLYCVTAYLTFKTAGKTVKKEKLSGAIGIGR